MVLKRYRLVKAMSRGNVELLIVTIIWAINSIAVKDALGEFLPLQFNVVRLGLSTIVLFLVMQLSGGIRWPSRKDWPRVLMAGFLGNTFYQYMFIKGISMSTASNTSFVLATMPATTAALSHFLGKQKLSARMWFGVFLTLIGAGLIITGGAASGSAGSLSKSVFSNGTSLGDLITLTGTAGWCVYTIMSLDLMKTLDPIGATAWTMFAGVVFLIPLSLAELGTGNWSHISFKAWSEMVFSAVFAIALSYIIWNRGVKDSGPARTAIFQNLTPIWTGVFGWLLLHETWNLTRFAGAAVILTGVSLVRFGAGAPEVRLATAGKR